MHPLIGAARDDRYCDRFVRETARRIQFLMAAARRHAEPARFIEDLRRVLRERDAEVRPEGS
jgi:hypothetical protein